MSDSEEEFLRLCYQRNKLTAEKIKWRLTKGHEKCETVTLKERGKRRKNENKPKRIRLCWVSDRIEESNRVYGCYGLVKELASTDDKIVQNLNISPADFYELLDLIKDDIEKFTTRFRQAVPADSRLALTLKYLNSLDTYKSMSLSLSIGYKSVGLIVLETCEALQKRLEPIVMPYLSVEKLCESAAAMKELTQFPNCVGVLNGKILYIRKYYQPNRYKGVHIKTAPVLFALVDARYCFLAVNVLPNNETDIQDFLSSLLESLIIEENMPPPSLEPESGSFLPYIVLGSECLPLSKYVITPYTVEDLMQDPTKGLYNRIHCQTLDVAEYAIGLMTHRYKNLQKGSLLNYENAETIIRACCCLHNFFRLKDLSRNNGKVDENAVKEALENAEFQALKPYKGPTSEIGQEVRQNFFTHFANQSNSAFNEECSFYKKLFV